jgi:hypothetical protein
MKRIELLHLYEKLLPFLDLVDTFIGCTLNPLLSNIEE